MGSSDDVRDATVDEMEVEVGERHRDKEKRERHRREEKDHHGSGRRDRDREKDKDDRRREKDESRHRDRDRERDRDKDSKHREREKEADRDRGRDRDRGKDREREPERTRDKDRGKDRERESERDKERDRRDRDKDRSRNRDKDRAERGERERDDKEREKFRAKGHGEDATDLSKGHEVVQNAQGEADQASTAELRERIARVKEERLKDNKEGGILDGNDEASEILAWVGKSRKIDEKRKAEEEKALRLARALEEQDNILAENDDDDEEEEDKQGGDHLSGVKVLHGLDKVLEGGAVVMTLKDQSILAGGDINEEGDMLENIEIGEQKQRDDAYKAARKKGTYDDKFNEDSLSKKSILSQYDDPMDEGVTLDDGGRFTGEAERKLEELRKRIEGGHNQKKTEDLTSTTKVLTDYFTPDEMVQFKKPKKKKSLRKKEKLDLDALEAEAIAAGLGAADLGSRKDSKRQSVREEEQKADAEKRSSAYQAAIAKAEEASKALRQDKTKPGKPAEEEELVFGDDYEDLQKSLEQARKLALRKQEETAASGPLAVVEMATANKGQEDAAATEGDAQQNKVVITEMEEFVWGLQLSEESRKPEAGDVFMDEDDDAMPSDSPAKDDTNGLVHMEEETIHNETSVTNEEEEVKPDEVIHEVAVGKGLAGALKILKERGSLNEGTDWGGRTTDKKKSKLVGIEDGPKDIRIERLDEFGRVMTPKEAFRDLSHKFHGKGPGKMKQEKRQKKYEDELKTKRMSSSDTPLMAAEKMREAQARSQTPFLVLSGNAKTSQSDASSFGTVEKEPPGSLTPMLGDKKVEHFLGIKRAAKSGSLPPLAPKRPKN
ncbi:hypothetical protein PR202_gb14360 [Eleusine coracana subsp. coracana]|uniref:SART-1 family protein DOT2 n=1 Tax=Eleusine coracana subsp. coracana TaxID=191504 RepID=A0AAV5EUD5_ELECO|nr:hypothetical protein QOZ80_4BG0334580 [Eleusine coracana subsp. coracana]GJN26432.1 hypothetical protein PR202_gb14360 [Eleusine coracana subsp. coracana]